MPCVNQNRVRVLCGDLAREIQQRVTVGGGDTEVHDFDRVVHEHVAQRVAQHPREGRVPRIREPRRRRLAEHEQAKRARGLPRRERLRLWRRREALVHEIAARDARVGNEVWSPGPGRRWRRNEKWTRDVRPHEPHDAFGRGEDDERERQGNPQKHGAPRW
jgi:hypothetical protein